MKKDTHKDFMIGDISVRDLKEMYQTPLYVMDEEKIRKNCQLFRQSFHLNGIKTEVIYASKAFLTIAMCQLIHQEGLSLDVVSAGELYTAIQANYPVENIYFHGNNKSKEELNMALHYHVGRLIIDHENEFDLLTEMIEDHQEIDVLLRINPGIEAHTHEYIKTTKNDSKFGVSIFDEKTLRLIKKIHDHPTIHFKGFHSHIGSQILTEDAFFEHAKAVLAFIKKVKNETGVVTNEMNLGGGFGAKYTEHDNPFLLEPFFKDLLTLIRHEASRLHVDIPKVMIEPGRAIVAEAGYTLYTISGYKETYSGKKYVFVDGSMADHIRTALYQAPYHAIISNKAHSLLDDHYTVAGKACESGDVIIKDIQLPKPDKNDVLVVFSTGAYHYSMSSNYNRLLKPAVVFVNQNQHRLVVKRETFEDLIRNDLT